MPNGTDSNDYDFDFEDAPGWADVQAKIDELWGYGGPTDLMPRFYEVSGLQPRNIAGYIKKMLTGRGAARRAGEFEERGLADVNRIAAQMFRRERFKSAATGGRGSSAEALMRARGGEMLAGRRGAVREQAATMEETLRGQMFGRGMGALGAWEAGHRGDWQQTLEYLSMLTGISAQQLALYATTEAGRLKLLELIGMTPEAEEEA